MNPIIEEVDLTIEELKLIVENMDKRRYNLIAKRINEQIDSFIFWQSEDILKSFEKFKKFFGKKKEFKKELKKGKITISNQIFWLWNMLDDNRRKKFNSHYEYDNDIVFEDRRPISDMNDIYITLLYRKYVKCDSEPDSDNDILNHECFNDLKKANMRENFKTFLKYNFEERVA